MPFFASRLPFLPSLLPLRQVPAGHLLMALPAALVEAPSVEEMMRVILHILVRIDATLGMNGISLALKMSAITQLSYSPLMFQVDYSPCAHYWSSYRKAPTAQWSQLYWSSFYSPLTTMLQNLLLCC